MTASLLPDPFGAPFVLLEDRLAPAGEARLYTAPEMIIAARTLGIPVIMIDRPDLPDRPVRGTVAGIMDWLHARLGV